MISPRCKSFYLKARNFFGSLSNLRGQQSAYIQNRNFQSSPKCCARAAYEGEGKTTVAILNKEMEYGLLINSYSQIGFRLNNGVAVLGPMVIFTRSVLSWKVDEPFQINEGSLKLFKILEPKIDLVVIGYGDRFDKSHLYYGNVEKHIMTVARNMRLNVEILPTKQALAAYNFLISETRNVAGAMIPPQNIELTSDDIVADKVARQTLYETTNTITD